MQVVAILGRLVNKGFDMNQDMFGYIEIKSPALRYHGAKFRIAEWIIGLMPQHKCYVEPFGGGAGVLLRKPRSYAEVYNDLDQDIVNFFRVLRDEKKRRKLEELCILTPYSRDAFEESYDLAIDEIYQALYTVVRATMGFGSGGATKGTTGFRCDSRREYGLASHLWERYPDNLALVGQRFQGVIIENRPAVNVMQQHDAIDTLHYIDPPYIMETRNSNCKVYRHEMTDSDHLELLDTVKKLSGHIMISGYESEMYNDMLCDFERHEKKSRISAGRGTGTRKECLWIRRSHHE